MSVITWRLYILLLLDSVYLSNEFIEYDYFLNYNCFSSFHNFIFANRS